MSMTCNIHNHLNVLLLQDYWLKLRSDTCIGTVWCLAVFQTGGSDPFVHVLACGVYYLQEQVLCIVKHAVRQLSQVSVVTVQS